MVHFNYTHYPQITNFVKSHFPQLHNKKPIVFETFRKFIDMGEEQAMKVLMYENRPPIKLEPLSGYGFTPPGRKEIQLHKGVVSDCERFLGRRFPLVVSDIDVMDRFSPIVSDINTRDKILLLLEATILHELVHWCRMNRVAVSSAGEYQQEENIAREFEKAAYGKYATVHTLDICKQVRDPGGKANKSTYSLGPLPPTHKHNDKHVLPHTRTYQRILNGHKY